MRLYFSGILYCFSAENAHQVSHANFTHKSQQISQYILDLTL